MCVCDCVLRYVYALWSKSIQYTSSIHEVHFSSCRKYGDSKWVEFDADTIRRVVNNAVYMFLVAMETEMCLHSYIQIELVLP